MLTGKEACCGEGECCGTGNSAAKETPVGAEERTMNVQSNETRDARNGTNESGTPGAPACAPGCGCHATGTGGRARWVLGAIVLLAAAVLVARAITKEGACQKPVTGFAVCPAAAGTSACAPKVVVALPGPLVGKELAALADLNAVATNMDAVFVYVPGKAGTTNAAPVAAIADASRTLAAQGIKVGLFTLKTGSTDHEKVASATPGVLAMVKGGGAIPVSGDMTAEKLVQAYVAASRSGCGAGGCGPSGCCK